MPIEPSRNNPQPPWARPEHAAKSAGKPAGYLPVIGSVILIQAALTVVVMIAGTGNGSFVGLGAMLFGLMGIPATALLNFLIVHGQRRAPHKPYLLRVFLVSSILPILLLAMFAAVKILRL